ncbi:hypothetical protein ASG38_12220 [Flavobacterium sp. Leaf359]|uniref:sacsin N-terminal ATP-binding-like domain-containing protein n=1 Tax=Flavobacterium sp. Leaf359 TaxID=1736351 RepID=UPI0006F3007A|nr:hypothetical protein [Flavobacterium sp. Leaf359]KQS46553.1 hypothetical protein ASG38_12220 [Flavobacterium sp. Leaf359]
MIDKNTIKDRRNEIAVIRHADSVYRDIDARIKERSEYEQRWFWELLQNAKDSISENQTVQIKIDITDDSLSFSHSGNPFELDDILSLIVQGSSKVDKKKVGRFGTGFMTTYLLSREVEITGSLTNNDGSFSFILNRNAIDNSEFYELQKIANESFDNSIREISYLGESPYQTRFTYFFDDNGKRTAETGLKSVTNLIPYTQLFNNEIASIIINNKGIISEYKKEELHPILVENNSVEVWNITSIVDGNTEFEYNAYLHRGLNFDASILVDIKTSNIVDVSTEGAKLFFTFPLIGTEGIGIPFVINSTFFDPKIERDGIYLNNSEDSDNNKTILKNALSICCPIFLEIIKQEKINNIDKIYNFTDSKEYSWIDLEWFRLMKLEIIKSISSIDCIPYYNNEYFCSFNDLTIPYNINEDLLSKIWNLYSKFINPKIPDIKKLDSWINVAKNMALLHKTDIYSMPAIKSIKDLIRTVEIAEDIDGLTKLLDEKEDSFSFLNILYKIIIEEYSQFPLDKVILLNMKGKFRVAEGMYWDKVDDDTLNQISANFDIDFPTKLISNKINIFATPGIDTLTKTEAVEILRGKLNTLSDKEYQEVEYQISNAKFLKWLIINSDIESIKNLKIINDYKLDTESIVVQPFVKAKHLILTPISFFSKEYPLYSNLIREKDCMHSIYNSILSDDDFRYLDNKGLIHYSPLVVRRESLDLKNIESLLVNPTEIELLKDEEGKLKSPIEFTYSDFAYLTASDGHIYERNSSSKSSMERFRFLFEEAVEKDPFFDDDYHEVYIESLKKTFLFSKTMWLNRARVLPWVIIKNIQPDSEKKFLNVPPNSQNLSDLIKNEDSIMNLLREEKKQKFLSRLGIGVSDLIRNTLPQDEKIDWDRAITNIITSNISPQLVQAIFSDPNIRKEYESRLNQRKLIQRNQDIGAKIEKLFKELIKKYNADGVNIHIDRKPFGSDYILSENSSDLVNESGQREAFEIGNWLIELKATGKEFAYMTELQAKTAVIPNQNYALVVVPLEGDEIDSDLIKSNAKVITNIGTLLHVIHSDYKKIKFQKEGLFQGQNGISVEIEEQSVKFKIDSSIWNNINVLSIEDFVLKNFTYRVEP